MLLTEALDLRFKPNVYQSRDGHDPDPARVIKLTYAELVTTVEDLIISQPPIGSTQTR